MICFNILYHFKCFKGCVPQILLVTFSSSLPTIRLCKRSSKIAALKYFRKPPGKQPSWSLLLNFAEKESLWVFQYEFFKFFRTAALKNTSERLFLEMSIFLVFSFPWERTPSQVISWKFYEIFLKSYFLRGFLMFSGWIVRK